MKNGNWIIILYILLTPILLLFDLAKIVEA